MVIKWKANFWFPAFFATPFSGLIILISCCKVKRVNLEQQRNVSHDKYKRYVFSHINDLNIFVPVFKGNKRTETREGPSLIKESKQTYIRFD